MPSPVTVPASINSTASIGSQRNILISSISRAQTVSINGAQVVLDSAIEFYSPIQCQNFYAPHVGSVAFEAKGTTSAYALLVKYENFAITTSTYDFTVGGGPSSVVAQIISDYASAGVEVDALGTVEDLIADTDIIDGLGISNINNVFVKVEDPSKLSPNSSNSYYYDDGVRERNFYLQTNTNGLRHTYNGVHPFSSDNLYIKSWTGARKCLIKLK